jgi:hypothetical protein
MFGAAALDIPPRQGAIKGGANLYASEQGLYCFPLDPSSGFYADEPFGCLQAR